jgi:CDP-glucose 4,6-dehydratase
MGLGAGSMEDLVVIDGFWLGKRVFITGHTGFKGSWLSLWLSSLGAEVFGFALLPPTTPSLFVVANIERLLAGHTIGDVRDLTALTDALQDSAPDVVFHMAAQPLVRLSYAEPVETFATNVMGTVNVLEAARRFGNVEALVNVTTDKCYENKEWLWGYRETEALGGHDPYSSSKACSELVTSAYRASFHAEGSPWIASARAGNVIGGGDWAADRLIPDVFRAIDAGIALHVRHPGATRPWQHVLEPLSGYMRLAEQLSTDGCAFAKAWNFGPADDDARSVGWILEHIAPICPELSWHVDAGETVHEASFLKLDNSRAVAELGWSPRWHLPTALEKTAAWYAAWRSGEDMQAFGLAQIASYQGTNDR